MYGFDYNYDPATEGAVGNFFSSVWRAIQSAAAFLRDCITSLASKLKKNKDDFVTTDGNARNLISEIGTKTESIIKSCSSAINSMFAEYGSSAGKVRVDDEDSDTTGRVTGYRANTKSALGVGEDDSVSFDPTRGHMKKADNVDSEGWKEFQTKWGKVFSDMHGDAEDIKKKLTELKSMPALSYYTTTIGYKKLKDLYDANGKFGKEWSQLKTAHAFANPTGKIKGALGKIVSMYNVGISAAKAFGNRLLKGNFRDQTGKKYEKDNDHFYDAKAAYYGQGSLSAAKKADKKDANRNETAIVGKNGAYEEGTKESALLSRLYDIAYEDAKHDLEMREHYISAFESVPDAFEMEDEFVDDFVPDPMFD